VSNISAMSMVRPGEVEAAVAARALRRIKDYLARHPDGPDELEVLVAGSGEALVLPRPAVAMFTYILAQLAEGRGVSVVPSQVELTTQQAADMLNVSRPYLIDLLENGKIPFRRVGRHRRITFEALLDYQRKDAAERRAADDLTELSQDALAVAPRPLG
jgi:excisionase family DNA binding protein